MFFYLPLLFCVSKKIVGCYKKILLGIFLVILFFINSKILAAPASAAISHDHSISGIDILIPNSTQYIRVDSSSNNIVFGEDSQGAEGIIYAAEPKKLIDNSAVTITVEQSATLLSKVFIAGKIDGSIKLSKDGNAAYQSALIIAATNADSIKPKDLFNPELTITDGIIINATAELKAGGNPGETKFTRPGGYAALKIAKQPITANITNNGLIDSNNSAISVHGPLNLLNGSVTNNGTISGGSYALFSNSTGRQTQGLNRKFNLVNHGIITGNLKICGNNCNIINDGQIGNEIKNAQKTGSISLINSMDLHYATATIKNTNKLFLKEITNTASYLKIISSGTIAVLEAAAFSAFNNQGSFKATSLILSAESTNTNTINLEKILSTAATITNLGIVNVIELQDCIIDNQATLTVAEKTSGNITISGSLILKNNLMQNAIMSVTNVSATNCNLINTRELYVSDSIKIKKLTNSGTFTAKAVDLTGYKIFQGAEVTVLGTITNEAKGTIIVNDITNANIVNKGALTIKNNISGKVAVVGKLNIDNLTQNGELITTDLEGNKLINNGTVTIEINSILKRLENNKIINCKEGNFTLTASSTNSGELFAQTLISQATLSNTKTGIITCNVIQDCTIVNSGKLQVKRSALGSINIAGTLETIEDFTNKANLVSDGFMAKKKVINQATLTITNVAQLDNFNNDAYFNVKGTLSFDNKSANSGILKVKNLVIKSGLINDSAGEIIADVLTGLDSKIKLENKSGIPKSLYIKNYICGDVTVKGWLYLARGLTQLATLTVTNIESEYLINKSQIKITGDAKLDTLNNESNASIEISKMVTITGYATNDGKITTNILKNSGFIHNKGNLEIKTQAQGLTLNDKNYLNQGTIKANTIIIPASFTNDGTLITVYLKNEGGLSIIKTNKTNKTTRPQPILKIGKSIIGDFYIKHEVEYSGDITLASNFTAKSLKTSKPNYKFIVDAQSSLLVLENAKLGQLINNGSITVAKMLYLKQTSSNNMRLSAGTIKCENTLTNGVGAVANFDGIANAKIDNSAANAVLEVTKCIEGEVNILGDLVLAGLITQGGNLKVTKLTSKEHGISVTKKGFVVADNIEVKHINNIGKIIVNKNLILTSISTNTGIIDTAVFNSEAEFNNENTATLTCSNMARANIINQKDAIFKVNKIISGDCTVKGALNIGTKVNLDVGVNLVAERITAKVDSVFSIQEMSSLEITKPFTEQMINIKNNQGILKIQSGSKFKSYVGNKGQIRLKIPANLNHITGALITVQETFHCDITDDKDEQGIILYTDSPPAVNQLHKEFNIDLIQAKTIKILKSSQEALIADIIASEKIKSSTILLYIDDLKMVKQNNKPELVTAKIRWLDVAKIPNLADKPIAVTTLAEVMQQFAIDQSRKALNLQLDHEIQSAKLRPEVQNQLDYLLSSHVDNQAVEEHLEVIKKEFFINVDDFAKQPADLFSNLVEYDDYNKYQVNKKISPLINPNFYELVEKVIIDNSDISTVVISENIKNLFSGISDRLVASRVSQDTTNLHSGLNLASDKNNAYTFSSFSINKTKEKKRLGYIINNFNNNVGYLGIDRSFGYLRLGWVFGYTNTSAKNIGTGLIKTKRHNTYACSDISNIMYCNYKQYLTSATFAFLLGHSEQDEVQELIGKKISGSYAANLLAIMSEFTYTYYIGNLNFDISSRFEYHHIVTPEHYLETEVELFVPTLKAIVKNRAVANRINLGFKACALYTLPIAPAFKANIAMSLAYTYSMNLQKDRIQEVEFFKKIFYIENKANCKHALQFDLALLVKIYNSFNLRLSTNAVYRDYSQSLGGKISLHYYF